MSHDRFCGGTIIIGTRPLPVFSSISGARYTSEKLHDLFPLTKENDLHM